MTNFGAVEKQITTACGLNRRPVAIAFRDTPPPGVAQLIGSQPSGCSFWRLAAAGQTFYTVPSDHYNCPIGSYTHNMPFGWIRSFTPHPMQILQNNENIAFLFEQSTMFQVVNTEGLPHRKDWPPTWFGDSRGRWDGDALVIEAVNFNGWTKLGTIGHPMSDQARLTMTFRRPDMGHMQFKWVLDDPKTYTRPIGNERVFVLTPDVELMEYSCMEGNLQALIDGAITPWLGSKDSDDNQVYDAQHQWSAYELGAAQKLSGVLKQINFNATMPTMTLDVDGKPALVILAPAPRMKLTSK